jgi:hypothetical protein
MFFKLNASLVHYGCCTFSAKPWCRVKCSASFFNLEIMKYFVFCNGIICILNAFYCSSSTVNLILFCVAKGNAFFFKKIDGILAGVIPCLN